MNPTLILNAIFLLICCPALNAQLELTLTIENQYAEGSNFYFDIYFRRSSNSTNGDIYLGNSDLVIQFNNSNFQSPTLSKFQGSSNLSPTISNATNNLITSSNYFDNTSTSISGQYLIINLNGPTPSDQSTFDSRVAKIDNMMHQHRLATFVLSGISNPAGTAGLQWRTSGGGLITNVYSLQNSPTFTSSPIDFIFAQDPNDVALPLDLISFDVIPWVDQTAKLIWTTANEKENEGFEIQRTSTENSEWVTLVFKNPEVDGKYEYVDQNPSPKLNYYRLKQRDFDGSETLSPVKSIFIGSEKIEIYPNPVHSMLFIKGYGSPSFKIMDAIGVDCKKGVLRGNQIDVHDLAPGLYWLKVDNKAHRFIKW